MQRHLYRSLLVNLRNTEEATVTGIEEGVTGSEVGKVGILQIVPQAGRRQSDISETLRNKPGERPWWLR